MKVLWLCNVMMPMIAKQFNLEASNKEGWLSGLASVILKKGHENGIELAVAFPAPEKMLSEGHEVCTHAITIQGDSLVCYGFREDVSRPEFYDGGLEDRLRRIIESCRPDMVHCFGTEYPHTLAMCRIFPQKQRLLISIQGLCSVYAESYFANMPEKVVKSVTLRDYLKRDSIREQQQKFAMRGRMEIEAVKLAGNIAGRTEWDRFHTKEWNPEARYYNMNETLRESFYGAEWNREACIPYSIFLSQGDYPIKGFHYMLKAMPEILKKFPDAKVYVAGNSVIEYRTIKQKLKISGYGKYLRKLIRENGLQDRIVMLGKLDEEQMRERYLKSHLFVCCSSIENSPNSLGEAMLLGMPCISADVGGVPSIFTGGEDGILYEGFRKGLNNDRDLEAVSARLANAVIEIWNNQEKQDEYCRNARNHAEKNHNREINCAKMTEIYTKIVMEQGE
ncbi:MAG: glycosyltransferase family 4 protein [Acetatifactor sp.]|nr:glycosyltransferase family 4 protein [Acetatifactor sp.]